MKKIIIKIKPKTIERNEMHFEVQKSTRAHIFVPKKGKGSYNRGQMKKFDYCW